MVTLVSTVKLAFVLLLMYVAAAWLFSKAAAAMMRGEDLYVLIHEGKIDGSLDDRYVRRQYVNDYGWHGKFKITEWMRVRLHADGTYTPMSGWFRRGNEFKNYRFARVR